MSHFDLTVLGCSGGPLEGTTCSYLLKPSSISYKDIITHKLDDKVISIDGGAGLGRLAEITSSEKGEHPGILTRCSLNLYEDSLTLEQFTHSSISTTSVLGIKEIPSSPISISFTLSSIIKTHLVTHPHMDHIAGLVVNSPAFGHDSGKIIYGLENTNNALQKFIFNDSIWPDLPSRLNGSFLEFETLSDSVPFKVNDNFRVIPFQINHGCITANNDIYHSTSFLIEDTNTSQSIIIFGDVEADGISHDALNLRIWKYISDLIIDAKLHTIVIECSTPVLAPNQPLYGHLTPTVLFDELITLSTIISTKTKSKSKPLKGVSVLITHVKDRNTTIDPRKEILEQLTELNEEHDLGCEFTILLPGQTYSVL